MAQTWNQEIAYRLGNMIGNEALLGGGTGWYAPAMNIHRTPYSGRNGEYYSEDSFLSGAMASQEVKGAAEKGVYTIMKHFAFNEQENHRGDRNGQYSMATWMNEQSARELYLKPFEMCMKAGDVEPCLRAPERRRHAGERHHQDPRLPGRHDLVQPHRRHVGRRLLRPHHGHRPQRVGL